MSDNVNTQLEMSDTVNTQLEMSDTVNMPLEMSGIVNMQLEMSDTVNMQLEMSDNVNMQLEMSDNVNMQLKMSDSVNTQLEMSDNVNTQLRISDTGNKQLELSDNAGHNYEMDTYLHVDGSTNHTDHDKEGLRGHSMQSTSQARVDMTNTSSHSMHGNDDCQKSNTQVCCDQNIDTAPEETCLCDVGNPGHTISRCGRHSNMHCNVQEDNMNCNNQINHLGLSDHFASLNEITGCENGQDMREISIHEMVNHVLPTGYQEYDPEATVSGTSENAEGSVETYDPEKRSGSVEDMCGKDPPIALQSGLDGLNDELGEPPRGLWNPRIEFFFTCLGYSVSLSTVWRFPYLVYKHGGGAFLLPYLLFVLALGVPFLYLEMALGQFVSQSPVGVWKLAPLFGGIGYAMVAVSFLVACYQNVLISWILYYLFSTMSSELPWKSCDNSWNSQNCCVSRYYLENCTWRYSSALDHALGAFNLSSTVAQRDSISTNISLNSDSQCFVCVKNVWLHNDTVNHTVNHFNGWDLDQMTENKTIHIQTSDTSPTSPAEEFFQSQVLGLSDGFDELGPVQWRLFLCLLLAWTLVFACVSCGIKSSGKVTYVIALAPYIILLGLLGKTVILDGARDGLIFYLKPQWNKLRHVQVWHDAATQVLLSLGPCYGSIITMASYNAFTYNFYRYATLIPLLSCISSFISGAVVFSALGHMSWQHVTDIDKIVAPDFGLAFIVYPDALSGDGPALSAFFFLMLLMVGVSSLLPFVQTIMATILDLWPALQDRQRNTTFIALGTCVVLLGCGIPLTTKGGLYLIQILDISMTSWSVYILGILECLIVTWMYGFCQLQNNIWIMIGKRPGKWWLVMWGVITPLLLLALLVFSIVLHEPALYKNSDFSRTASIASWVLPVAVIGGCLICYAMYTLAVTPGSMRQRLRRVVRPPRSWGPSSRFAEFVSHQFWLLPDYMVSEKEAVMNPAVWNTGSWTTTNSDAGSVSTVDGFRPSQPGVQQGDYIDTGSVVWSEDENKVRGNWSGRFDMLFAGLGYSVGMGNIWRFPYLVYKNGGGAFFVPYVIMLVFCGIPLVYMEFALGQFASVGPITVWRISPLFKGVGYAAVLTVFLVCIYYNVFTAWSIYYMYASMTNNLPWASCNNTWNTEDCRESSFYNHTFCKGNTTAESYTTISMATTNISIDTDNMTLMETNDSFHCQILTRSYPSPSEEYFFNKVLGMTKGIDQIGGLQWHLVLCLFISWLLVFAGLFKGIKSAGKVVYVTVIFPYIILMALLVRFVTLDTDAHLDGIKYYVTPVWEQLSSAVVWGDAASQLFFSLGLCMGGLVALGSYNRFHYDCYRDAYLISCVDTLSSVFAGFVIFAILGVMAEEKGRPIDHVVESSFALAFIAYPDAVARLPHSTVWAILFFLMMFCLAIDSQFLMMEAFVISVMDEYSKYLWKYRIWLILGLCFVMFLLGLPLVSQGGLYLMVLVDSHVASWSPLIIGILMCVAVAWVYRVDNFCENIKCMIGHEPRWWWKLTWRTATPGLLVFILLFSWIKYEPVTMDHYVYPRWAQALGILMALTPIIPIPIAFIWQILRDKRPVKEVIQDKRYPDPDWGPALEKHRISCFLPSVVNTEDTMARVVQWVVTGHQIVPSAKDTLPPDSSQIASGEPHSRSSDSSPENTMNADRNLSAQVNDTTEHSKTGEITANKLGLPGQSSLKSYDRRKNTPDEYVPGKVNSVKNTHPDRLQAKASGTKLRVWFPNEEEQQSNGMLRTVQKSTRLKVKLKEKAIQTDKSFLAIQKSSPNEDRTAHCGLCNPAFSPDATYSITFSEHDETSSSLLTTPVNTATRTESMLHKTTDADSGICSPPVQNEIIISDQEPIDSSKSIIIPKSTPLHINFMEESNENQLIKDSEQMNFSGAHINKIKYSDISTNGDRSTLADEPMGIENSQVIHDKTDEPFQTSGGEFHINSEGATQANVDSMNKKFQCYRTDSEILIDPKNQSIEETKDISSQKVHIQKCNMEYEDNNKICCIPIQQDCESVKITDIRRIDLDGSSPARSAHQHSQPDFPININSENLIVTDAEVHICAENV